MKLDLPNIYLGGSSSIVDENRRLRDYLVSSIRCNVLVPQDYISCEKQNEHSEWQAIFRTCKKLLDKADCIVINLNGFGKDTAAEIGYSYGCGKPIIGLDRSIGRVTDVMVHGFLFRVSKDEASLIRELQNLRIAPKRGIAPHQISQSIRI